LTFGRAEYSDVELAYKKKGLGGTIDIFFWGGVDPKVPPPICAYIRHLPHKIIFIYFKKNKKKKKK